MKTSNLSRLSIIPRLAAFTRYNRNRLDNRLYRVYKHATGCQAGWTTGLTTGWMFVYTMQPVVQPVGQPVVSCKQVFILSLNGLQLLSVGLFYARNLEISQHGLHCSLIIVSSCW